MNTKEAIKIVKSGRFFSAEFIKKDGTTRKIVARSGVRKYLRPNAKPQTYDPRERGYFPVYDLQKKDYRLLNIQTITVINRKTVEK
jgi:hypothetical protein